MMGRPQPQEQGTGSARGLVSGRPALVAAPADLRQRPTIAAKAPPSGRRSAARAEELVEILRSSPDPSQYAFCTPYSACSAVKPSNLSCSIRLDRENELVSRYDSALLTACRSSRG